MKKKKKKKLYQFPHGFLSKVKKLNSSTGGWRREQEPEANTTFWTKEVVIITELGLDFWATLSCVSGANNLKTLYLPTTQATMTRAQLLHRAKMGGTNELKISTFQACVCKPNWSVYDYKHFLYISLVISTAWWLQRKQSWWRELSLGQRCVSV